MLEAYACLLVRLKNWEAIVSSIEVLNESSVESKPVSKVYKIRLLVFFLVSFVILLYPVFAPMVNRDFFVVDVLFQPVKCASYKLDWNGRQAQEVTFTNSSGNRVHALYFPSPKATRVILFHHGQYGNIKIHLPSCDYLLQPENSLLIYDYAGFGKSEGSPSLKGMVDDSRAAYDYLVKQLKIDPKQVIQCGGSLGTGPAALIAAEQPCAALILLSPYTSIKTEAREIFPFLRLYPDFLITDYDFDSIANVSRLKVPVLIVHGTSDICISVHHSDDLFAAAHAPKSFLRVPGGGHQGAYTKDINEKILSFIRELN